MLSLFAPPRGLNGTANYRHSTWAGTYQCFPSLYFQPETIDQVQELVRRAQSLGQRITVVGAAHSSSILTMTSGWLLNLDHLNRVLRYRPGDGFMDITVEAGIRLYDVNELLANHGLALQNLGSISEQSIGGVISTGTHGSSAYHGLICQQIVDLTLVDCHGDLVKCSDSENRKLFRAALLSLGKFGVIVKATIRTIPAFNLDCVQEVVSFDYFISKLWPSFFTSAEFHRVWWYPYTNKCILWHADKTLEPETALNKTFVSKRIGRFVYELLLWVSVTIYPPLTPFVERWLFSKQFRTSSEHFVVRSDKGINMDCFFKQYVNEWALPLTQGKDALMRIKDEIEKKKFYVHAPFEIRVSNTTVPEKAPTHMIRDGQIFGPVFGNLSRPYLDTSPRLPYSPPENVTYDNLTLNLNATMYRPFNCNPDIFDWFSAFEDICSSAGGKPHWAKNFLGTSPCKSTDRHKMRGISDSIDTWYGEDVATWRELRKKLDPTGVFCDNENWMRLNGLL